MDNICTAIQSILQTALGSSYTIIYGDDVPGMSQFPYISIEPQNTTFTPNGTGGSRENRSVITVTLKVRLNDYMQDNTDVSEQAHLRALVKGMEERETNGLPKNATILGALNQDLSLGGVVSTIELGTIEYGTENAEGSYIRTATLTIEALQQLPFCTS